MRKYLYGFKLYFLNAFHYRFNTIVNVLFSNLNILIQILFWIAIYKGSPNGEINVFSLNDIITYYIMSALFRNFILMQSGFYMCNLIKDGGLNGHLLKPYDCNKINYFNNLSRCITNLIPQLVFTVIISPFVAKYLTWNINLTNLVLLICFLMISSISSHLIWSLIGYSAFMIEEANSVMWSFAVLFNFLSGMFIPLDFFPKWCVDILQYLPSSTWGYIPTKIYLNLYSYNEMIVLLIVNIIWIIIFYGINKLMWSKGVKLYSSIGG